jgi:hypothetical protein
MKGAMIGVAANTFKDFLGQLIPGFHEEFEKTAQAKSRSGISVNSDPERHRRALARAPEAWIS